MNCCRSELAAAGRPRLPGGAVVVDRQESVVLQAVFHGVELADARIVALPIEVVLLAVGEDGQPLNVELGARLQAPDVLPGDALDGPRLGEHAVAPVPYATEELPLHQRLDVLEDGLSVDLEDRRELAHGEPDYALSIGVKAEVEVDATLADRAEVERVAILQRAECVLSGHDTSLHLGLHPGLQSSLQVGLRNSVAHTTTWATDLYNEITSQVPTPSYYVREGVRARESLTLSLASPCERNRG